MKYEIRIRGQIDSRWSHWFQDLSLTVESENESILYGEVPDQSALHGLLKKIRDLGIDLISVNPVNPIDEVVEKEER